MDVGRCLLRHRDQRLKVGVPPAPGTIFQARRTHSTLVENVKQTAIATATIASSRGTLPVFIELAEVQDANMSTTVKDPGHHIAPKIDSRSAPAAKSAPEQPGASSSAGRIVHDSRGNAVWTWDKAGDAAATASTSKMLKKLDIGNLQVEGEMQAEKPADTKKRGSGYGPGYNPYDRTAPVRVAPKKEPSR